MGCGFRSVTQALDWKRRHDEAASRLQSLEAKLARVQQLEKTLQEAQLKRLEAKKETPPVVLLDNDSPGGHDGEEASLVGESVSSLKKLLAKPAGSYAL